MGTGDRVVMIIIREPDFALGVHRDSMCVFDLIDVFRKRLEFTPFHRMEAFLTRIRMLLHTGLVMSADEIRYGLVQLHQGVEDTFAQFGIYTLVDAVHIALHRGFVRRLPSPGRKGYEAVMVAHVDECFVHLWSPSVCLYDGRLEIIRDYYTRHPSKGFNAHPECVRKVLHLL